MCPVSHIECAELSISLQFIFRKLNTLVFFIYKKKKKLINALWLAKKSKKY